MSIKQKQDKLSEKKGLSLYEPDELKYLNSSNIAKAIYKHDSDPEIVKKKTHWKDRIKCEVCGKYYFRSGTTKHRSTQHHKTYAMINEKLRKLLLD